MARTNQSGPLGISARMAARVVSFVAARGHDPEAFCRRAGVSMAVLRDPAARVPYALVDQMGELAAEITRDPCFGLHLAQDVGDVGMYDAGALLLMSSASLRSGLERLARYQRYWGDGERFRMQRSDGLTRLRYALPDYSGVARSQRHADECALAEITLGARMLTGVDVIPLRVSFRHAAPVDTREHAELFRSPIEFGASHTEIEFDDAVLELPLPHANEAFRAIFETQVQSALASLPGTSGAAESVRETARAALAGGECTLVRTAKTMGLSARTLQRRLQAEGTTFDLVVDSLRRELATEYLARSLAIGEIAALLGYADASAFHHAFKRWTGKSPEGARRA